MNFPCEPSSSPLHSPRDASGRGAATDGRFDRTRSPARTSASRIDAARARNGTSRTRGRSRPAPCLPVWRWPCTGWFPERPPRLRCRLHDQVTDAVARRREAALDRGHPLRAGDHDQTAAGARIGAATASPSEDRGLPSVTWTVVSGACSQACRWRVDRRHLGDGRAGPRLRR